jgi:hypothetical protein
MVAVAEKLAVPVKVKTLRVWEGDGVGVKVKTLRVWSGALVSVALETLRVWVGADVSVAVKTLRVWLGVGKGVSLAVSPVVGVSDANDAVSNAKAVCTPLGVVVAWMGDGVGGAPQATAAARAKMPKQQNTRLGQGTREL